MKNIFITLVFIILVFSGCEEIMPTIPDAVVSDRVVLIEEFTGVGCQNCPGGSVELGNLLEIYPNNLIAVSIHAGFFSKENKWHPDQRFDLRCEDGISLTEEYFGGEPFAYPSATINRELSTTNSLFVGLQQWPGKITSELEEETSAFLLIDHSYNSASRELTMDLFVDVIKDLPADVRLSIMITESDIVDYQLDINAPGDGWVSDYVHKHVLRDMITSFEGEDLSNGVTIRGSNIKNSFTYEVPADFVPENCEVIAFIHRNTTETREVLQAASAHLVE